MNEGFYNSILSRTSVRRYRQEKLDQNTLQTIENICSSANVLVEDNRFNIRLLEYSNPLSKRILGGFGMFMRPSHVLVPSIIGTHHVLEDLGYRIEQIILSIWQLGIGSCYIGCVDGQNSWKNSIPEVKDAQIIANVAIGYPSDGFDSRMIKSVFDNIFNTGSRLPVESIYFQKSFSSPAVPSGDLAMIINAGRMSPSAINAQPWRFLDEDNRITLYIKLNKSGKYFDKKQLYAYHDAGICMANMKLAADAIRRPIKWNLMDIKKNIVINNCTFLPISFFIKPGSQESVIP